MRLIHYINEEKEIYKLYIQKMKKDCKKFINEFRNENTRILRIDRKKKSWRITPLMTRNKRKPTDTPKEISDIFDNEFKKKFGWKARTENVIFCWIANENIKPFSNFRYVFPVGDYKYVWSPKVNDLYQKLFSTSKMINAGLSDKITNDPEVIKYAEKTFKNELINTYINKDITKYFGIEYTEVMINCKKYYLVSPSVIKEVNEKLNLHWDL